MASNPPRIDLQIDVLSMRKQRAKALPTLTPIELIEAILKEFTELEYLGGLPDAYELVYADDRIPLDPDTPIRQVGRRHHLAMIERKVSPPAGTHCPSQPIYLREINKGVVYALPWLPAIIGRPADPEKLPPNQPNEWLVVDLSPPDEGGIYETGRRVARRHAQISELDGQFYIESLSMDMTTTVRDSGENKVKLTRETPPQPLHDGDMITLDYSQIVLKFIVRPETQSP